MINSLSLKILKTGNYFFLLLFVVLSYHNRLAIDDFHFLHNIRNYSIIDATTYEYGIGSTRWFSVLLNHFVISFYESPVFLFEFHIFSLLLLFLATRWLIINLNKSFSFPLFAGKDHTALFLINAFFYSTIGIGETWFWLCAACTYLFSSIAIIAATAWLMDKNNSVLKSVAGLFSFIVIGGTSESSVVFLAFLFLLVLFLKKWKPTLAVFSSFHFARYVSGSLLMLVSFYFLYTGGGMEKRQSAFDSAGLWDTFLLNFKTTGMIIILKLPLILPFIFLFTFPFIAFSVKNSGPDKNIWRLFLSSVIVSGLLIFIYQFPVTYKTNDIAANRALTVMVLMLIAFSLYTFIKTGNYINIHPVIKKRLVVISLSAVLLLNIFQLVHQYLLTSEYARAYDARMEEIEKGKTWKLIELDPLPSSGMLYSAEISKDTAYFTNYHLAQGLELKGNVKLKD